MCLVCCYKTTVFNFEYEYGIISSIRKVFNNHVGVFVAEDMTELCSIFTISGSKYLIFF